MTSGRGMGREVEARARERCEYCRMHQSLQGATFHVEHIMPRARGGLTQLDNLAWACPSCNLHKSNRTDLELYLAYGDLVKGETPRKRRDS
jgi:5-methylcytosine-specific restriction endonuclease McrA